MVLQPIQVQSATQRVTIALREAIFTKELLPGQRITQAELAKQLHVSITPVREALMILEMEQLLKIQPHKETIILGVSETYLRDYYETRSVLECHQVARVCSPDTDITAIEEAYQRMEAIVQAGQYADYGDANTAFHRAIWETAGNDVMNNMLSRISISRSTSITSTVESFARQSFQEHERIMAHIRNRDAAGARDEMAKHMERSMQDLITYYADK